MEKPEHIHLLDEATINQIAAGEVIERPASVVKELIDNSLDSGASDIRVEIEGAGSKNITVIDDGSGIGRDEVPLAFTKHSTSKIESKDDLHRIITLGFRGEALSSIAAVSRVELISRTADCLSAVKIGVEGGLVGEATETGSSVGTRVEVRDLFYNTPARRKYLKSKRTELSHITDTVTRQALGNPGVAFTLLNEGKVVLRCGKGELFDRMVQVLGADVARQLIPLEYEDGLLSLWGYISKPGYYRSNREMNYFFINGRNISSPAISNAVRLGYYTMLAKGRYPAAVLNVKINLEEVDVNVHPAKRYVRLSRENEIMDGITAAVEQALKQEKLVPEVKPSRTMTMQSSLASPEKPTSKEPVSSESPVIRENTSNYTAPPRDTQRRLKSSERAMAEEKAQPERVGSGVSDARILGQVNDLYIVAETDEGILLIDQHAAHERIMYEQISRKVKHDWQELISPVTVDLTTREKVLLEEYIPYLENLGFSLSEFGTQTYVITTVPTVMGKIEDPSVVYDLLADLFAQGRVKEKKGMEDMLCKTMACRSAIKAGASCNMEQMQNLLDQLEKTENPYTCPHGRPTMITLGKAELDKLFKRTGV
ncbi:DNA mismatch repair endonuclease MutL [Methanohalophilus portucalensis]|uniref:DNA mismatch repair protein MutL n=2 Tax=Methanohalophilus portucalensis TaxID=39664 RepID=A0A1L9C1N4_9EURY|nr:DNA mismatch repair endonuclease MutL [Methanohalophilus portucalensis]ATU09127.1 DNA mismatch repair protein MutL [Methanohalophilus portucalensis]OJH48430.1 DNA mismatch repair protein MutL [Methanohalophilus portucalensis FDF-1]RNI08556.1 DNA mismatch repair endonuclease MutL [Methanohalophilus portucalensis FDF-1]SMH44863.1 DNA mismatch repair protein MutL [Methanohalophilus portucalensis FDF-1]